MKKTVLFCLLLIIALGIIIFVQDEYDCAGENRDQCLLTKVESGEATEKICDEMVAAQNKESCFFNLAQQRGANGKVLCEHLNPDGTLSKDYCYYSLALSERDSSLCQEVSSSEQRSLCTKSLAMTEISK